ncbi:MAG: DUF2541 family protein [Rhizobacter sp.]|nr:DUF2541 family protein [Ferruginibacter sp.]
MKRRSLFAVAALLFMVAATTMSFNFAGWRSLGTKTVNYKIDHDVLDVQLRDGRFKQLRFVVKGGSLNMHRCVVHFENGGQQEVELRHNFDKRSFSRIVDLKGNSRIIERISFWYDTQNSSNNRAKLSVLGK